MRKEVVERLVSIPERWSSAIDGWTCWARASGMAELTIVQRRSQLRVIARRLGPDPFTASLNDLVGFMGTPGWRPETRKGYRAALRSFYAWALDLEYVDTDPTRRLRPIRIPATLPRPAPDSVLERALERATDRDRLILMLGAYAGLRRSEIAGLRWDQINEDSRLSGEGTLRFEGKGGKVRSVPLHPALRDALLAERHRRDAGRLGTGWRYFNTTDPASDYVFPGPNGGHIRPDTLGKAVTKVLGAHGWTAHTLRHRFATKAYSADRDLLATQRLLGHSKPETTSRYADVSADAMLRAVRAAG